MAQQAKFDQQNRDVEVDRGQLIDILEKNRKKHVANYKKAVIGYKKMALQKLEKEHEKAKESMVKSYKKAKQKVSEFDPENPSLTSNYLTLVEGVQVELKVPRNYSDAYDLAIDIAKWDVNKTLTLTNAEFQCFVRDQWDWKDEFEAVSKFYFAK